MKILDLLLGAALVGSAFGATHDLYFRDATGSNELLVGTSNMAVQWMNGEGQVKLGAYHDNVRIRVIDPPASNSKFGFDLERPFLILDGIYLSNDGKRTLSGFQDEAEQFGLPNLLKELGYTPVLVQFAETVERSLEDNSESFSRLLRFMNRNKLFGFPNGNQDGFIVMGISQGGILGRYGSYLYDKSREANDAPVRLYASLDSPHQGAVMPKGLRYAIEFWATEGGSEVAEQFMDLIEAPGASGLLLYQKGVTPKKPTDDIYVVDTSRNRFLFGPYRNAAEYDGFPAVLVSQGQMKGVSAEHQDKYYELNRKANKLGLVFGRAVSSFAPTDSPTDTIAWNRMYKKTEMSSTDYHLGTSEVDFVQGSTYPFAQTLYTSLRDGFKDAIPKDMEVDLLDLFGKTLRMSLTGSWDKDTLYQPSSTFIPTVSAMDLKCNGKLAMGQPCAFTERSEGFPFENPGERSSANAAYAVDKTHPRYKEAISGRHIELPGTYEHQDTTVLRGMQTDIWRLLCEVAKRDYDSSTKSFRNPKLSGVFVPEASCMDLSKMPDIVKNSGFVQKQKFGYARYDYNQDATESNDQVRFNVPAGWHKVASFSSGKSIPEGSTFEVNVKVNKANGGWAKAELLITKDKGGVGQVQLQEFSVPLDGDTHTLRWNMPSSPGSLNNYKWFRLVVNSGGVDMDVSKPRLVHAKSAAMTFSPLTEPTLFPSSNFVIREWNSHAKLNIYRDALGDGVEVNFDAVGGNVFVDLKSIWDLSRFNWLEVSYWPGTCQNTRVYFDSFTSGAQNLVNESVSGNFIKARLPIVNLINTDFTQDNGLSASKLFIRSSMAGERCLIKGITLQ